MSNPNFSTRIALAIGVAIAAIHCGEDLIEGEPPDNNNQNPGCSACSGETVCVENICEDAFPRFYEISVSEVIFPTMKSDGECWDEPGCGAPDPEIEIILNGDKVAELDTDDDNFMATFTDAIELQLVAGSRVELELEDEDLVDDETVLTCRHDPLTAAMIRGGDIGCTNGGAQIKARISIRGGANP